MQLTKLFLESGREPVVLIGGPQELSICQDLYRQLGVGGSTKVDQKVFNLAGKTGLRQLSALISQAKLLVANDSAPIHFASAHGTPTVAIFGATTPEMGFGPLGSDSRVVETSGLPCRPCSLHGPQKCPLEHFKCMRQIQVNDVWQQAQDLLA